MTTHSGGRDGTQTSSRFLTTSLKVPVVEAGQRHGDVQMLAI